MRQIGHIKDAKQAQSFADYLVANQIRNEIEEDGGAWAIWIKDEEQVADAKMRLEKFQASPEAAEFRDADSQAAKVRAAEAEDMAKYRQRLRSRQSVFPKFGGYGVGALTYALIIGCLIVAAYSRLGENREWVAKFVIADPANHDRSFLPEVCAGEWWRLITPMFLHFGPLHLIFNLMWLYQLGCMIEARLGKPTLAALVFVTGVLPILGQYIVGLFFGLGYIGGMSGVIYGLAGFVWMRGRHDRASGVGLDHQSWVYMIVWLVLCYTGWMGNVANTAHLVGLIIGLIWGRISAWLATRRPG